MKKAMRKLRQKIADALTRVRVGLVASNREVPMTLRGIQAGNIAAFEMVLEWIDETTEGKDDEHGFTPD